MRLTYEDPLAASLLWVLRSGDLATVERLLTAHRGLADVRLRDAHCKVRTPLLVVTDWPGFYPHAPAMVRLLLDHGASVDPAEPGEGPLHWAASTDDAEVAQVLVDGGADLERPGASIAGGPPLDDAVGYGCWHVARLLVARGARVDRLWHASALGLQARFDELAAQGMTQPELDQAFWHACQGGQRRMAEHLLALGADAGFVPDYEPGGSAAEVARRPGTQAALLADWLTACATTP